MGIDLTSSEKKPTYISIIDNDGNLRTLPIRNTKIILETMNRINPKIIAIDSPFQHPKTGLFRPCDRIMKKMGMKPLPPGFKSMEALIKRAKYLLRELKGNKIIETFPTGALNILGIKKIKSRETQIEVFTKILDKYELKIVNKFKFTKDALDSLICAIAAMEFINKTKNYIIISDEEGCSVVIPRLLI